MINTSERRLERMNSGLADTISAGAYNAILMGLVLYGFIVNAAMVAFLSPVLYGIDYIPFLIGYFVCVIAGTFCAASDKPAMSFLGYNLIVLPIGVLLCQVIPAYSSDLVMQAILLTGAISLVMLVLAAVCPHWFAGIGRTLAISLGVGLVLSLGSWLLGFSDDFLVWGFAIIFTLYIGYDLGRSQAFPKTLDNAIDSALDLYLDIINLFLRILRILAKARSRD
ncbi:MAG: US12 family protein [Clostridia bacterium]|nr:US12 family protein [Clostridia bacterium]